MPIITGGLVVGLSAVNDGQCGHSCIDSSCGLRVTGCGLGVWDSSYCIYNVFMVDSLLNYGTIIQAKDKI